jgi:hypothetical protein
VLINTRDQVTKRLLAEYERRKTIMDMADNALSGLHTYLVKLSNEYELGKPIWTLRDELEPVIRARLIEALTDRATPEEAHNVMRRLVKRGLGLRSA